MANEPDQHERLELQYRAPQEDLRPRRDEDQGCAIIFLLIAVLLIGLIAVIMVGRMRMRRSLELPEVSVLGALALLAGLSIVAVCGRLSRHRWWGNRHWKEYLPRGKPRDGE